MATANYNTIAEALRYREPFEGNTMRAVQVRDVFDKYTLTVGRLPVALQLEFIRQRDKGNLDYVVYSYTTPIAWVTKGPGNHGPGSRCHVTIPDVRYSTTTTRQQNLCRAFLHLAKEGMQCNRLVP